MENVIENDEITELPERFAIDSEDRANWLLRKLANLNAERERIKAQSAAMIKRLDTEYNSLSDRFLPELEAWSRERIEQAGGKRKSLPLFQGTVAFRKVPQGLKITDRWAATLYAQQNQYEFSHNPLTVDVDSYIYAKQADDHFKATGELLPGMEITPERESFSIKWAKAAGSEDEE